MVLDARSAPGDPGAAVGRRDQGGVTRGLELDARVLPRWFDPGGCAIVEVTGDVRARIEAPSATCSEPADALRGDRLRWGGAAEMQRQPRQEIFVRGKKSLRAECEFGVAGQVRPA
jgi:hypothetical protein